MCCQPSDVELEEQVEALRIDGVAEGLYVFSGFGMGHGVKTFYEEGTGSFERITDSDKRLAKAGISLRPPGSWCGACGS